MSTEVIGSAVKAPASGILGTTKAFILAHPVGVSIAAAVLLGLGGKRYFSKRKQKKAAADAALGDAAAQAA
ncbi:MAG: hypothetical protein GKR96_14960 [Gammaproteobacteria bacterium]|nr:hypothetical protein [Gammaproteobacteria bacterium]